MEHQRAFKLGVDGSFDSRPVAWEIERLTGPAASEVVEPLFHEYATWAAERLSTGFGVCLDEADLEHHHEHFRRDLPRVLGGRGRLLVALRGGDTVGVGALKPVGTATAEIKRMYVRPIARGSGVGRAILEQLLADARVEGYQVVRLETLRFMVEAHALYRSVGFVDTVIFDRSEAAMSGLAAVTHYMELEL